MPESFLFESSRWHVAIRTDSLQYDLAMSNRETLDYDPVDALIEQGRRELAAGKIEKARWCFEEVLTRRPDEPRALLGLSYAARKSEAPGTEANKAEQEGAASVLSAEVEVVVLVREKRYDEALAKLRAELTKRPDDAALLRSIAHLEQHINRPSAQPPAMAEPATDPEPPKSELTEVESGLTEAKSELKEAELELTEAELELTEAKPEPTRLEPDPATRPETPFPSSRAPKLTTPPKHEQTLQKIADESPPSPLATLPSPEVEFDPSVTQPFELMKVVNTHRLKGKNVVVAENVVEQPESADAEPRLTDFTSSGSVRLADEDPSVPALGSLPPTPVPASPKGAGATWWIFALLAIAAIALALALR